MKQIKWSSIIIAICYIASGILFFADEGLTRELICTWIGIGLVTIGALLIIAYFAKQKHESFMKNEFRDGLILATLGLLTLVRKDLFIELIYFVIAIVIMISGFQKIQDCVDAYRVGYKNVILYFVLSSISVIIGLIIIVDPTIAIRPLHTLIGGGLCFSGVSDLVSAIFLSRKMTIYANSLQEENKTTEN